MRREVFLLILFISFIITINFASVPSLKATTYYVSVNGSDNNNGSLNSPFRTIQKAADVAVAGDKVIVKAGIYHGGVVIKNSGTSGNPIVFEGERGLNEEWVTIIDGGDYVNNWVEATEIGSGIYKTTEIGYDVYNLTVNNELTARIKTPFIKDGSWRNIINKSPDLVENLYNGSVKYWDGIEALYVTVDEVTYIRFRNYDNPNTKEIKTAPNMSAGISLKSKSNIIIKNFKIRNAYASIYINGNSNNNVIENNILLSGRYNILMEDGPAFNHIRNNEMTMNSFGFNDYGAWGEAHNLDYKYQVRQNMYANTLKGDSFTGDRCIFLNNIGDNNEIYENHLYQNLSGIGTEVTATSRTTLAGRAAKANYGRNLKIYNNIIHNMSSTAIRLAGGEVNLHIYDNLIYDSNINLRLHDPTVGPIYVYRNRFASPINTYNHIYYFINSGYSFSANQFVHPEIFIYHNSFAGNNEVLKVSGYAGEYGLKKVFFINNILDSNEPLRLFAINNWTDAELTGSFVYNWYRGELNADWNGGDNIKSSQKMWNNYPTDFYVPINSASRNAGIDLSKPFTIDGKSFNPLPGMEPGYFSGSNPDIGAPPLSENIIDNPTDIQPPSVPQNLSLQIISDTQINLIWNPATDNVEVAGYKIFRDGSQIASTDKANFSDTNLRESTSYTYTVLAYDAAGNESNHSSPVTGSTFSSDNKSDVDYIIYKSSVQVTIDGDISEFASSDSISFYPASGGNFATVKTLWDSEYLYIGYKVSDTQLNALETKRDGDVWSDDAVEWFVDVNNDGGGSSDPNSTYMNLDDFHGLLNILNTQFDCCGTSGGTPTITWDGNWDSAVKLNGTLNNNSDVDNGFSIEVRIPWSTLGLTNNPDINTIMSMSFSLEDKDATEFSYVMWPDITDAFQNASKWQPVLLSDGTHGDKDNIPPNQPIGLKVNININK